MNNLDDMLKQLGNTPLDPRLAMIDENVFSGLAKRRNSAISARPLGLAAFAALVLGIAGGGLPGAPAIAAPLGSPPALAPSSLLLSSQ
jgi:hypothetical protein